MKIKDIEIRMCRHKEPVLKDTEMRDGKKSDLELFSGEFWSGSKAKDLGLIDEIGDANQILREKFGEDVIIKKFEKSKSWLSKKLSSSNDNLEQFANILEEKSIWQKYGL